MNINRNKPPLAKQKLFKHKIHDDIRIDEFYWLNDRENPKVFEYLKNENEYYEKMTLKTKGFQNLIFNEMKSRIKEDETSVPYFHNKYWYITKYEKGKDYPIYVRRKISLSAEEEILFNCNELANDHEYFNLSSINISPDNKKAAFSVDLVSRRLYTIRVKDLESGKLLDTKIENTSGGSVWSRDSSNLFYTTKNTKTLRSESVYRHNILSPIELDSLIYKEKDNTFSVYVSLSKSEEYIFINSYSTLTTESRFIKANEPFNTFKLIQKRIFNLEYSVAHYKDTFYVFTNADGAFNFKIMKTSVDETKKVNWKPFIVHREDCLLEDLDVFENYFVLSERINGLTKIFISSWDSKNKFHLPIKGQTYTLSTSGNITFNTSKLRYNFSSLTSPHSVIEFDMQTKRVEILKEQNVLGGSFKKENYISTRIWASGQDDVKIPISLVYKKNTKLSLNTPILLYAYGAYGHTIDPDFSSIRLSLLDRGFVFAIAHVRGGEYLGRKWYDHGKLLNKRNTFNDFISCSKHLINMKFTSKEHLYAYGGSAGGLLMGVIVNQASELYNGVIAAVPFVDVVTTMLDETIPLTTSEFDEWGNPKNKEYYYYIKSYSPYDNVKKQNYPNMLVTSGFYDSQVQYWEPAKWVSRIRKLKLDNNVLYFNINLKAGHGGASGRYQFLREKAKEYMFLLDLESINK